jgi:hypothetical protein
MDIAAAIRRLITTPEFLVESAKCRNMMVRDMRRYLARMGTDVSGKR